ncbi:MAG: hypothetical protein QOI40_491, partial [Alphaproteobacteria bacterium]|nr:hypothetical protein [Alphaproteobacteria bacterium]
VSYEPQMSEVQLVPSPLAGEGVTVVQRILMGEGAAS